MAVFTSQGIVPTTLPEYVERLQQVFFSAMGNDISLDPETPQGQIVGLLAQILAENDEALVAVSNGMAVSRALGSQQDDLGSLLNTPRLAQTHSIVSVMLAGTAGTVVSEGARARTDANDVFALTAAATVGADGTVAATMRAVDPGPVAAPADTLTSIVDLIVGWTGVNNTAAATLGHDVETDIAYRDRYRRELMKNTRSSAEAIQASVLALPDVVDVVVYENDTAADVTLQNRIVPAHSVYVIVDGVTTGVAETIYRAKTAGTGTAGDTSVDVDVTGGRTVPIKFTVVSPQAVNVSITTTIGAGFPANGLADIKTRVADWFAGRWQSGPGDFDTTGIGIGETLDVNRLLSPINSIPGHSLSASVAVERKDATDTRAISTVDLHERFTCAVDDVSITT